MIRKLIFLVIFFAFLPTLVFASGVEEFFGIFGSMDEIIELYKENYIGVDFFLYMLIFGSVLKATISKKLGTGTTIGIAVALSIAMVIFAQQHEFMIGDFWFVALILLASFFISFIYKHMPKSKSLSETFLYLSIGYLVFYAIIKYMQGRLIPSLYYDYEWLHFFLELPAIIATIYLVFRFIEFIREKEKKPHLRIEHTKGK
ncbi:MAG: hypothetical protein ACOCQG_03830 [Candidatus Nanoarchaeia archaeon]